jgi:hypothetical protein
MAYTSTLQKLAESLTTTYKNTIFQQSGDVGDTREKVVLEYLRKVMPRKYGFQSGEVFDKDDKQSGQVDVIIYDNLFSTVFSDGSDKVLAPVESTFGVISVKSKMGTRELDDAIAGVKKFDSLTRTAAKENAFYIMPDMPLEGGKNITLTKNHQQNINCIFAFETTVAIKTVIEKVKAAECIDLLVIPGKLCLIGRYRGEFGFSREDGSRFSDSIAINNNSISLFIILLQLYLSRNHLVARDIESLALWLMRQSQIST